MGLLNRCLRALDDEDLALLAGTTGDFDAFWDLMDRHLWPPNQSFATAHALHWLLTGQSRPTPCPAGFLLGGGKTICEDYDARAFTPSQVDAIREVVNALTGDVLQGRLRRESLVEAGIENIYCWRYPLLDARRQVEADPWGGMRCSSTPPGTYSSSISIPGLQPCFCRSVLGSTM